MSEDKEYKDEDYRIVEDGQPSSPFSKQTCIAIAIPMPKTKKRLKGVYRAHRYGGYADFLKGLCDEQDDKS